MKVLVTGSSGLIGSQCVEFFIEKGYDVIGVDNDMRAYFFGAGSSTSEMTKILESKYKKYKCHNVDIRDFDGMKVIFEKYKDEIELIVHTAAQPSHDWAAKEPMTDFSINALGTMNLLELFRLNCPKASFIFTSTNKVYGDRPNKLDLIELEDRYEHFWNGAPSSISESMSIDNCVHSVFGASKVAADIMVQEYGKYFNLNTVVFRGGCLTGPNHQGAELHGFLSYLVKCILNDKEYTIYGYKGKQVRDNIHSWDLVNMFWRYHQKPTKGEVYNAGGGRENSISIIEAINKINQKANKKWKRFSISGTNRVGDHIWYISDLSKFKSHYPGWDIKISLDEIITSMVKL